MINLAQIQVQSPFHLLIFRSAIHQCFLIIFGLYVSQSYDLSVCEDRHNSDHFPIIIEQNTSSTEDHTLKWKLNRANWDIFNTLCISKLIPENFKESPDPISDFTLSLIEISKECIAESSTNPTKRNPWYNNCCKEAIKQRKQGPSKFKWSPNLELKPAEQLKFQNVCHGDVTFFKSIIKHLSKCFGI